MASFMKFFAKVFGTRNQRFLKTIEPYVAQINEFEPKIQALSDEQLAAKTVEFRERLDKGETLEDVLAEAFAVVREAGVRKLFMRHYDVQLIGGIVLHRGRISEMKTGEGKTLVATLPAYLNALTRRGVHVVTVNDYLAKRDAEWMGRLYTFLGLTVGVIVHGLTDDERRANYACDITYGTNNEFGFDYLRDNMKFELKDMVHRYYWPENPDSLDLKQRYKVFNYAIVDEVDSILIDEARTPLIISGSSDESTDKYVKVNSQIPFLKKDMDYAVDEKSQSVALTDTGVDRIERRLGVGNLYDPQNIEWLHHLNQALRAHTLFKRDVNYLVEDGKVIIVDEFTGRKMPGRRWSDGLHQAIEAKEGLEVEEENQTLATITFQNLFRMYSKLSGMTGTADTEADEFQKIYDLDVSVIPTHRDMIRIDNDDMVYKSERAKFAAVCEEIKDCHRRGQPVLVGTVSVEKSELVAKILIRDKVPHNVLNAKNHAREADIVAQAGRKGSVTISTNMAGRGTDILLGGNPENMARSANPDVPIEELGEALEKFKIQCKNEHDEVVAAGGMHIIGTERHESRRVDNQLRGRAGRQGDPGSSRFYLSLEDDLLRIFGGDRLQQFMDMLKVPENEPIIHRWVTKSLEKAQKRVEEMNFGTRKNLIEFDDVLNQQRMSIYDLRRRVMAHDRTHEMVLEAISDQTESLCAAQCPETIAPEEWDLEGLATSLKSTLNTEFVFKGVERTFDKVADHAIETAKKAYQQRCQSIVDNLTEIRVLRDNADEGAREKASRQWDFYERERYMRELDKQWRMHLVEMESFKEGVYLNSYAQKDPKLIYKREGYNIFSDMMARIRQNLVEHLFRVEVRDDREIERLRLLRAQQQKEQPHMNYVHGDSAQARQPVKPQTQRRDKPKVGRNDPCPCGSGKKYKQCCLAKDEAAGAV